MSPTASEKVVNRPLSGLEYKELLRQDFDKLLENEGLLSPHVAFGRVAHTLGLHLHLDSAMVPDSHSFINSKAAAASVIEEHPELGALGAPPLADVTSDAVIASSELHRKVESPNEERLRLGLPIPVDVREQDGTIVTKMVEYPPQPDIGIGNSVLRDSTLEQAAKWTPKKG